MTTELQARSKIVQQAQRIHALNLSTGTAGNVSMRWQRDGQSGMLITPTGIAYEALEPHDLVFVRPDGSYEHPLAPSSEWRMHSDLYIARAEAQAIVHAHPTYSTVLAIRGQSIPALHYMVAAAGGPDIRCAPYHTYGTAELSAAAVKAMEGRKACLLANHGILVFERDLDRAMALAVEVETLARQYVLTLTLGGPQLLSDAEISVVLEKFKNYGLRQKPAAEGQKA